MWCRELRFVYGNVWGTFLGKVCVKSPKNTAATSIAISLGNGYNISEIVLSYSKEPLSVTFQHSSYLFTVNFLKVMARMPLMQSFLEIPYLVAVSKWQKENPRPCCWRWMSVYLCSVTHLDLWISISFCDTREKGTCFYLQHLRVILCLVLLMQITRCLYFDNSDKSVMTFSDLCLNIRAAVSD